jgi:hypothetical protein
VIEDLLPQHVHAGAGQCRIGQHRRMPVLRARLRMQRAAISPPPGWRA